MPAVYTAYVRTSVNSYKRLVEEPGATTLTWAVDNRTVALRALPGGENLPGWNQGRGSDSNPFWL